jgi:AsmA-like C-terminal region
MSKTKKRWLMWSAIALGVALLGVIVATYIVVRHFEPLIREQAIRYLRERFDSEVELKALHVHMPKRPTLALLRNRGRGAKIAVDGEGLSMWFGGARNQPPLFSIRRVHFIVDFGTLAEGRQVVDAVTIDGIEINVPPKGNRPRMPAGGGTDQSEAARERVLIKEATINNGLLVILPKDKTRNPLRFEVASLRLTSVGPGQPMKYDAAFTIPRPPGQALSKGVFGPWLANEPGDTPLKGEYKYENADLGVFKGIAGTLASSGTFDGTLDAVHARGEATVPNFRLKMTGTPVPLTTSFEVLVDGTNGDTVLQPVKARLGHTAFTTTGAVIKHQDQEHRTIDLKVAMPNGDLRDLLRLAMKGSPFMEGRITLNTSIRIPPLSGRVKQKLILNGSFNVRDGKFLRSTIQAQLDELSRRGQGQPGSQEIDQVLSKMKGSFRLENQVMTFRSLSFGVPGADVDLAGAYDMGGDTLDFHGSLKLQARVSQTVTGWKKWALKPVDPLFARNGAGTFLRIKVEGTGHQPKVGLEGFKSQFGKGKE